MNNLKSIQIGERTIDATSAPFIIAELSGNHDQSLDKALAMVDAAADAGACAIKLQTYTADSMTLDIAENEFVIRDEGNLWKGRSLYDLYQQAMTPWEWHEPIFARAKERGLLAFSSPFDKRAVDFLERLDVPCYKIASFENSDHGLLAEVAATGKPVIMSTGMATQTELAESVDVLKRNGCRDLILLKCTSQYPAMPVDANLVTIPHLSELFDCQVGLSDHTPGVGVSVASVVLGATVIEKHFVLDRGDGGVDAEFSLEPDEFSSLVVEVNRAAVALGKVTYGGTEKEKASRKFRRSLYICEDMNVGDIFTEDNLRSIRPGLGLAPKYLNMFIGKRIAKKASKGSALSWEHF